MLNISNIRQQSVENKQQLDVIRNCWSDLFCDLKTENFFASNIWNWIQRNKTEENMRIKSNYSLL